MERSKETHKSQSIVEKETASNSEAQSQSSTLQPQVKSVTYENL